MIRHPVGIRKTIVLYVQNSFLSLSLFSFLLLRCTKFIMYLSYDLNLYYNKLITNVKCTERLFFYLLDCESPFMSDKVPTNLQD